MSSYRITQSVQERVQYLVVSHRRLISETAHLDGVVTEWAGFEPTRGMIAFLAPYLREPLASTSTRICAVAADPQTAHMLQVGVGSPLLQFVTLGLTASGEALYRNVSFQSGDLLDVHISRLIAVR